MNKTGRVFLIGAGPGDTGLLTLKGMECLRTADVIIYDELANKELLDMAKCSAELVYVGKKAGCHSLPQDKINALIVSKALEGKTIARLKGGDPFIFGRGGEEAQELARAGIPFDVIPGVTSAIAVPAYAGIPLTHRDFTSTVAFVTGHEDPTKKDSRIAWGHLANAAGTIVFLMGVGNLEKICAELINAGRSPSTPIAVIERGTLPMQRTVTGDLENIGGNARQAGIRPPAVIVLGEVVALREELAWFEKRPLFGKGILVTRAREQASRFIEVLSEMGARCYEFPTIEIAPPDSWQELDNAIDGLSSYSWIVSTSVNGVKFFLQRLYAAGKDGRALGGISVAAIGPKTAEAWQSAGIRPDLVPDQYVAEAVVTAFKRHDLRGKAVLIPRAMEAREVLPQELERMGASVHVVTAYRTVRPHGDGEKVRRLLKDGLVDMITFTSSSTVKNFVSLFTGADGELSRLIKDIAIACIGPVTAKTAESYGLTVSVIPESYTIEAFAKAISDHYRQFARSENA